MSAPLVLVAGEPKAGRSPAPSVSDAPELFLKPTLRQVNCKKGSHYMRKVDGVWTCECGEQRDKHGKPIKTKRPENKRGAAG